MKKLFWCFLVALLIIVSNAWGQQATTYTPNLHLALPYAIPGSWGADYNGNFVILDSTAGIARVTNATKPPNPVVNQVIVVTDSPTATTCTSGGGTVNVTCQWTGTAWVPIGGGGGGGGGSGHILQDEGVDIPNQPLAKINCVGAGIACTADVTNDRINVSVGAGGGVQPLDPDLTALADNTTAGFWAATTNIARSMATANTNNITITNPAGIAGNPTWDVGANVALSTRSFTVTAGDWNFAAAASLTAPIFTGAAPTLSGRMSYDSTANRYKFGVNGTTVTIAHLSEVQLLNSNLTAIAGLTGSNNLGFVFSGPGTIASYTRPGCSGAGQAINYDAVTHTEGCVTFSGSISGGTLNAVPIYASSSTLTPSIMSQSGSTISIAGSLTTGSGFGIIIDPAAVATSDKTWTAQNISGIPLVATTEGGAITDTNVAVFKTTGGITRVVNGGAAGTGTWTDSSTNTGTNKTINVEGTGNVITTISTIQLDFASCVSNTPGLQWDDEATGLAAPAAACNDTGSIQRPTADFSGSATNAVIRTVRLPKGWTGNIDWYMRYVTTTASPTGNTRWEISTVCRGLGESWDGTFNTAQAVTDAVSTQNFINEWRQNAITTTGCGEEDDLTIRIARIGGDAADTNNDLAKGLYGVVTLRWVQQAQ